MTYDFDQDLGLGSIGSRRWDQPAGRVGVLGMGTADLDFACPPCVREAIAPIVEQNVYDYRVVPDSYYEALLGWFLRRYGMEAERDWFDSVPSTIAAIRMAIEALSRPGDAVIMQTPHFMPLEAAALGADRRVVLNPMSFVGGRYELDLGLFERQVREERPSVLVLVSPHNPTGRVFSRGELEALVDVCARHGVRIVSDDVHCLITYDGLAYTPLLALSEQARAITVLVTSFSKGFNLMGLPHALVIIADEGLRAAWHGLADPYDFGYAPNPLAVAAVTSVASGAADGWLEQVTSYLQANRDRFLARVAEAGWPLRAATPEASYLLWADCREAGLDPQASDRAFLNRSGIKLNNGLQHGEAGRGFVRINFGVRRAVLEEALGRLGRMFG